MIPKITGRRPVSRLPRRGGPPISSPSRPSPLLMGRSSHVGKGQAPRRRDRLPGSRTIRPSPLGRRSAGRTSARRPGCNGRRRGGAIAAVNTHQVAVILVDPERQTPALVGVVRLHAGGPVLGAFEVRKAVVEHRRTDRAGVAKSNPVPPTGDACTGIPRSSDRSTIRAGSRRRLVSTVSVPTVRYGCAPHPYGHSSAPTFVAVVDSRGRAGTRTRCVGRARTGSRAVGGACASTTRTRARSPTRPVRHRTRPWIAFEPVLCSFTGSSWLPAELVACVRDAVGPGREHLSSAGGAQLVDAVAVDYLALAHRGTCGAPRRPR